MKLPNGFGSVHKLPGKRRKPWRARVTIAKNDEGKQIYKTIGYFESKNDALIRLSQYHENPLLIDNEKITFKEVYDKWSEDKFKTISKSSIDGYKNAFSYCCDVYDIEFYKLKYNALQKILDKADGKLATQKKIKGLLGLLYDYAMANDIVDKDYSDYLITSKTQLNKLPRIPFNKQEIKILWENVNTIKYIDIILILLYTGMRPGELLDLKKENIFLEERYMIGGLKTEAGINRIIPIHKKIAPFIKKYYESSDSKYLISNTVNNKVDYRNFKARIWDEIMDTFGFNHKPHDTRHTFATRMDDLKVNKMCIKMILGHSLGDVTDRVYTHKTKDQLIEAMDMLEY